MDFRPVFNATVFSAPELADDPEGVRRLLHNFVRDMR